MKLQDTYFKIDNINVSAENRLQAQFEVTLLEDHPVYQGHFPGEPVSPGVCSLQMVKECAQILAGKEFFIGYVKQYKLLSVMTPQKNPKIIIGIQLTEEEKEEKKIYKIKASATDAANSETKFLDLSGELTPIS